MNFNKKTDLFRLNINQDLRVKNLNAQSKELQKVDKEKLGETTIVEVDVKDIMPETVSAPKITSSAPQANEDNIPWDNSTNLIKFIRETLTASGIEPTDELTNEIFKKIVKEIVDGNFRDIGNVALVTQLIDIYLNEDSQEHVVDVTQLIDVLLSNTNSQNRDAAVTTVGDVKNYILAAAEEISPQTPPVGPDVPDEPVVINTPEDAINAMTNKLNEASFDENTTINDFLLTLQAEASRYIQLKFGYDEGFSDVVAIFVAKVISDNCDVESGLMKDADLEAIKNKFLAQVQDMNFLNTSNGVTTYSVRYTYEFNIDYIKADYAPDGYITRGEVWFGDNSLITYGPNGTPNNGVFLKFLTDYMKNDIYGGTLTESQLQYIMQTIIEDFGKGYLNNENKLYLRAYATQFDKNNNNTFFDEFYAAIIRATEDVLPIDVENADSMDLDKLFGNKSVLTAADIHTSENDYLVNNDPGIRAIFAELVNVSDKYNITTDIDYLDFLNVFIRMFNEKCGVPNTDPPSLSRSTLENYLKQPNAIQELRDFVMSKELRNAYYMESFAINGEIEDINQGVSGDCWLVSDIIALKQTEAGREILRNAIHDNGDGTYSVTFKVHLGEFSQPWWSSPRQGVLIGGDITYTFSMEEIMEARASGNYNKSLDWDGMLLELAVEKFREENIVTSDDKREYLMKQDGAPYLYGGTIGELIFYLTGHGIKPPYTEIYEYLPEGALCSITYPSSGGYVYNNYSWRYSPDAESHTREELRDKVLEDIANGILTEGTMYDNYAYGLSYSNHAYAIVGFTAEGILYVDPYHSNIILTMSWDEFLHGIDGKYANITGTPLFVD